jgi:hypothetical protein
MWRIIGMIFEMLKCSTKLDIYFSIYVGVVSRRESVYINIVWIVMSTAIYVRTRLKMTSTSFSTALQLGNAGRLLTCYLSWIITHINRVWLQIKCLRCAAMKTVQLWVELQRFFGAYSITEMT